jgi:hypothetical protein
MEMRIETAVLTKLRRLPQAQQQEVLHFVEFLEAKSGENPASQREQLAAAAQALLADYETDDELTAFTALDGEDFHA